MADKDIQLMYAPEAPNYELSLKKILNDGNWKFYHVTFNLLKALPNTTDATSVMSFTSQSSSFDYSFGFPFSNYFSIFDDVVFDSNFCLQFDIDPIPYFTLSFSYCFRPSDYFYLSLGPSGGYLIIAKFPPSANMAGNSFDFYFSIDLSESPLEQLTILPDYEQYFSNWKCKEVTYDEFVGASGGGGVTPTGDPYILQLDQPTTQVSFYKDPNLLAENIKKDITIEGVTGTLEQGTATQDEYSLDLFSLDWTGGEYTEPSSKEGDKIVLLINYKLSNYDDPNGYLTVNSVTYKNADLPDRAKGVSLVQYLDRSTEQTITYSYTSGSGDVAIRNGQFRYFGASTGETSQSLSNNSGTVTIHELDDKSYVGSYGILDLTYDVTESSEGPDPFD